MTQISSTVYLPEFVSTGMEDPTLFHQYPMDSFPFQLDDFDFESFSASPKGSSSHKRLSSESTQNSSLTQSPETSVAPPRPTKQPKTTMSTWSAYATDMIAPKAASSSSSKIISFDKSSASSVSSQQLYKLDAAKLLKKPKIETGYGENLDFSAVASQTFYDNNSFLDYDKHEKKAAATMARNPTQAQDHVIAERKRREKLSQRFIALSALVPGLKKTDKATVLEDAIKYVKQLQERVKILEEQTVDKTVESAIFVKRSVVFSGDDSTYSGENTDQSVPEIEARISGKEVLVRLHCDKHSGRTAAILRELEKHNLTVQSSSFLPFGNNTLDITIVAKMGKDYCLTAKDLIRSLSQCLRQLS
ncbi:transcription factor bHLH18 isoform X1 [Vigna radiata var. radiata]|uniref:Transcription factor bHLH18 isoform X1 n=1 Tax=Vigna radiata var. radiata TaxID=3916 RepID=A0A1S3UIP4_VIGRR|nr:transcription factor bHLH18 isoform X1 [Vigna radiata var. radiata]